MTQAEAWTVGRLLTWTADYLKKHDAESPRLDAEVLLAAALGCKRIELYTSFENLPPEDVRTRFRELVRQRAEGRPVAYLVGHREFYSLDFVVNPAVLIPRPETELVVVALLDHVKQRSAHEPPTIADVGTGSGILAVCAARKLSGSHVTALDISREALVVAKQNAERHGVDKQIRFIESDLFAAVPDSETFDYIVSNPPYVSEAEFAELAGDVAKFEPRTALVAGPRGTEVIERLMAEAVGRLRPGGWLLIEISPMIDAVVRGLFDASLWELGPTIKDLARLPRVVQAQRR